MAATSSNNEAGFSNVDYDLSADDKALPLSRNGYHDEEALASNRASMELTDGIMKCDDYVHENYVHANNGDEESVASIASSVATVEGIHDYPGYYCICLVILIGDMSRGVMFPTMWPLVKSLGGSPVTLGYAVASFSFGRVLVNPLFGYWSDTKGYTITLLIACAVLLLGTLLYAQIQNVGSIYFLVFAQIVLGIGSGTLGVTRSFVADVTDRRHRTKYMGWTTAVQYGGFTMTPAIGSCFIQAFEDGDYSVAGGLFRLNKFTAPAYFMSAVVVFTIAMIVLYFKDRKFAPSNAKKSQKRQNIDDFASSATRCFGLSIYDCCIIGCMLLNVSTRGSIACFETLGIAIGQDYFDMSASHAGFVIACCGTLGVITLLCMGYLEERFSDVQIISGGLTVLTIGVTIMIFVRENAPNPTWQYDLAVLFIYAVGYPIANTAVLGMFSKSKSSGIGN